MSRPSVTLSFPRRGEYDGFGHSAALNTLVQLVLRRPSGSCEGWTKHNLKFRLAKLIPSRACILGLFIRQMRSSDSPSVFTCDGQILRLEDLSLEIAAQSFCPTFLFLVVDESVDRGHLQDSFRLLSKRQFVAYTTTRYCVPLLSLACEMSRWHGLRSIYRNTVSYSYWSRCVEKICEQLNTVLGGEQPAIDVVSIMRDESSAWSDGKVIGTNVDYDKFLLNARPEQQSDALKRIADLAFSTRGRHLRPDENLRSSQGLFWLTELPPESIDFDWFRSSRFSTELFGPLSSGLSQSVHFSPSNSTTKEQAEAFLSSFVSIPSGYFTMGSATEGHLSEPPANAWTTNVGGFRILQRPVTVDDWRVFAHGKQEDLSGSLPVVNRNAFEAMLLAEEIQKVCRAFGLIGANTHVSLPSETQWEVAARGFQSWEYPWGNVFESGLCNCDLVVGQSASPPGQYPVNANSPFGCQDMAGNVREWTRSYGGVVNVAWQIYGSPALLRDLSTLQPSDRLIVRGGSYSYDWKCVRTWVRNTQLASRSDGQTGFRLVIEDS